MIAPPSLRIGFGVSGPLGQFWFREAELRAVIRQALDGGVTHFDTAPFYFDAEKRLGAALAGAAVFISTKTGTRRHGRRLVKDFSATAIREDVAESRRRLGRPSLDLLYLHGPTIAEIEAARPVLDALKREGRICAIGVCGEGEPLAHAVGTGFDAIMGAYNVLDRRHEEIFAEAKRQGVLTVAVAPLAQGLFDPRFNRPRTLSDLWRLARARVRGRYPPAAIAAARRALGDADPAAAALGFVLSNRDIDIVMTTTTKPGHLAATLAAAPLSGERCKALNRLSLDPELRRS
ncbi:MAG: hypothetical protein A3E78_14550 [Alphaproteobacteria bacterium RIFCSPHIGHO2_12_FULL_63_12]|nr:MAG: hypothetical protein A3E78_14550 [Alphaproteobacteria bacterium RIFCSPHIGHO2_12_FULL_63_12]